MLDVTGRLVVVVGGGSVAARKIRGLLDARATRIRCVAPDFHADLPASPAVQRVTDRYNAQYLEGAGLVFAATDSAGVNDAVMRDARSRGVLVSRADADEGEPGDFSTPALFRDGPLTVTVSAGGNPAMAAFARDRLRRDWDPLLTRLAEQMMSLRPLVHAAGLPPPERQRIMRELATEQALDEFRQGGPEALVQWLIQRHPEFDH
jgi:siroheme synthase-like protein